YDDAGTLQHVGVCGAFTAARRKELVVELEAYRADATEHPWAWSEGANVGDRRPGGVTRWNAGKDLSWVPLRPELVCEVAYDHMQGTRFRHAARFVRWRPDKRPEDCRYDQLEVSPPYELGLVFGSRSLATHAAQGS